MRYSCLVKPGSSHEEIVETPPKNLTIYLRAKPHDGEANSALIRIISKHFKVPKTTIKIISGQKSRTKLIEF